MSNSKYAVVGAVGGAFIIAMAVRKYRQNKSRSRLAESASMAMVQLGLPSKKPKERVAVDALFFSRFVRLLKIMVPSPFSREFFFVVLVGVCLVARSLCDIYLLKITTSMEAIIISRDGKAFPAVLSQILL